MVIVTVKHYIYGGAALIIGLVMLSLIISLNGAGGLQEATTLSGIYVVESPQGYDVACFVKKSSGAIDCVPRKDLSP